MNVQRPGILNDGENFTEERVDDVLHKYLKDVKEGLVQAKNWPSFVSAYVVSKAAKHIHGFWPRNTGPSASMLFVLASLKLIST